MTGDDRSQASATAPPMGPSKCKVCRASISVTRDPVRAGAPMWTAVVRAPQHAHLAPKVCPDSGDSLHHPSAGVR